MVLDGLLDVGCNEGRGLSLCADNGFQAEGLELNEAAAALARRLDPDGPSPGVALVQASLPGPGRGLPDRDGQAPGRMKPWRSVS
jgi:hypothetical protein